MERTPPPELPSIWLPTPAPEPEPFSYFESFAFTIGPVMLTRDVFRRLFYGDQEARAILDRSDEIRSSPSQFLGIAKEDAAAGEDLRVRLDLGGMDSTLDEIRSLPETPA